MISNPALTISSQINLIDPEKLEKILGHTEIDGDFYIFSDKAYQLVRLSSQFEAGSCSGNCGNVSGTPYEGKLEDAIIKALEAEKTIGFATTSPEIFKFLEKKGYFSRRIYKDPSPPQKYRRKGRDYLVI